MYSSGEVLRISAGEGLELRQVTLADAAFIYGKLQDSYDHINDSDRGLFESAPDLETFLECVAGQNPDHILLGMWHDERVVGHFAMSGYAGLETGETTHVNVGYCVLKDETKKGFASRALRVATDFLIDDMGMESVDALIDFGNVASAKTAQKAGLKFMEIEADANDKDCWRFGREREWDPVVAAQFGEAVSDEVVYGKTGKRWIKLDGVDDERTVDAPTRLHVMGGILTVIQDQDTIVAERDEQILVEPNKPYRMVGRATMYEIPSRRAVAA